MRLKIFSIAAGILLLAALAAKTDQNCIQAKHRYEGHPKPNIYIVTVSSVCEERQIVKVIIGDAIYGAVVHEEEFPMNPGESRSVSFSFTGEKFFSYQVSNHPPD